MPIKIVKEIAIEEYFLKCMAEEFPTAMVLKYEVRRNEPDRICVLPHGLIAFVELKRPGKTLRPGQQRAFDRLINLGHRVFMANSKESVDQLIPILKGMVSFYGSLNPPTNTQ